jgi:hypothetical protein
MWTITGTEVLRFQGHGEAFTEFVDALIRAEGYVCGLLDSAVNANIRVNLAEWRGGHAGSRADDRIGNRVVLISDLLAVQSFPVRGH